MVERLSTSLVSVFVSIEMTGQGVEFEHKFKYRQPMYVALEYIWRIDSHRSALKVSHLIAVTNDIFDNLSICYMEYEMEGCRPRGRPKRTWREVVQKDCEASNLNREDAVDRTMYFSKIQCFNH